MGGILSSLLAGISLGLRQPLASFCDVESTHGDHLITKRGEYVSVLRINGLRRMCTRQEVEALAEQQRIELQGLLEERGHAIVGWYISDPERSGIEIDRLSLNGCRSIARQIGADLSDVIEERRRRWPNVMRWEATCYVLWTRPSVLTREDRKQVAEERRTLASQFPRVGNTQRFALRSDIMAARHESFISRVQAALQGFDISCEFLGPHQALQVAREATYRETAGSA
ncbi:secretion protein, partial [Novacetimonas pomaceti]